MKAYHGADGKIRMFRPMENMKRLSKSGAASSLPVSVAVRGEGGDVACTVLCCLCSGVFPGRERSEEGVCTWTMVMSSLIFAPCTLH